MSRITCGINWTVRDILDNDSPGSGFEYRFATDSLFKRPSTKFRETRHTLSQQTIACLRQTPGFPTALYSKSMAASGWCFAAAVRVDSGQSLLIRFKTQRKKSAISFALNLIATSVYISCANGIFRTRLASAACQPIASLNS